MTTEQRAGRIAERVQIQSLPPMDRLWIAAAEHYGEPGVSREALIAYIRHNYTNYDRLIAQWDDDLICRTVRRRVNNLIEWQLQAMSETQPEE